MGVRIVFDPIDVSGNKTHDATSWELSKSSDFTVEQDVIARHPLDTENLVSREFDYEMEPNEVLFGRVKVHFSDDSESGWSIIEINEVNNGFTFDGTIIQTPVLTIGTNELGKLPLDAFDVTTSEYHLYTGNEEHHSTSWRISDIDGNVVFNRPMDEDNLTSIVIPSGVLQQTKMYTIEAQFVTENNSTSSYGKKASVTEAISGSGSGVPLNREGQDAYLRTPNNSEQGSYSILPVIPKTIKNGALATINDDEQLIVRTMSVEETGTLEIIGSGELIFLEEGN